LGWIATVFHMGGHSHAEEKLIADPAFAGSQEGIRTVWLALALLLLTTLLQVGIYLMSNSVALLADTVHNLGDALNSVPLLIAFYLARRRPNRRYTYGYYRAEDVAGVLIVLSIIFSAAYIFYESISKLLDPTEITNLGAVAAAAVIGFLGNEAVAWLQIRTGRKIGSAALVADGQHARVDGLTSLAVLVAAGGAWLGFPILDPIIGMLIGIAILFITWDATKTIWYRLMDAIEPEIYDQALAVAQERASNHDGLEEIRRLRMRWMGHRLHADLHLAVQPDLTTAEGHDLAEHVRIGLFEAMPLLAEAIVHVEPWSADPDDYHRATLHREPVPRPAREVAAG
jgi:cation diffusion facilitator family transporter